MYTPIKYWESFNVKKAKLSCYVHKAFDMITSSICVNIQLIFYLFFAHKTMYLEKLRVSLSLTISVYIYIY